MQNEKHPSVRSSHPLGAEELAPGRAGPMSAVPSKAPLPIVVRVAGRCNLVREVQPRNASSPIVVRAVGRVREVREVQPRKHRTGIVMRAAGSASSIIDVQWLKAPSPRVVRLRVAGKINFLRELQPSVRARGTHTGSADM